MRRWTSPAALAAALAVAGCSENQGLPTDVSPSLQLASAAPVCKVIEFEEFAHGGNINTVASGFGFDLTVTTDGNPNFSADQAVAFDTDVDVHPDFDLRYQGAGATCVPKMVNGFSSPGCQGLGNVLTILDNRGFAAEGDSPSGGTVSFTGFAGNGTFYVESFKGIDQENVETPIELFVDGVEIASTNARGDGTVEVLTPAITTFTERLEFVFGGSGAVDGIKICQEPEQGGDGCTPGYWKQAHHFDSWPDGYEPDDDFDTVFGVTLFGSGFSLLDALKQGGGQQKALGRHAVAALLNSASGDVSYDFSTAEVIALVQSAVASGDYETAKNQLADFNEQGCPLN